MNSNDTRNESLQSLLRQLRGTFLEELPEKFDRLEYLLLMTERDGANSETFQEIYRIVHSLKGSGGTVGLHIITTICHQMEDLMNSAEGGTRFTPELAAHCLKYLDLLQLAASQVREGKENPREIEQQLAALRQQVAPTQFSVLLASQSKLETDICLQTLAELPVHTVVVRDGLDALTRALAEPFHLVITANELARLNGPAVVSALRLSDSRHARKVILLTSNKAFAYSGKRNTDADYTIFKDAQLPQNLAGAVRRALDI